MLKTAGYINIAISIGHLVGLIWAEQLFDATGIREEMNELAQVHFLFPYALTLIVSIVFFVFGLYAFSAAGKIKKLPCLRFAIFGIAGIYLFRGAGGLFFEVLEQEVSAPIEIMYSLIALVIGFLFLYGGIQKWRQKEYLNQGNGQMENLTPSNGSHRFFKSS